MNIKNKKPALIFVSIILCLCIVIVALYLVLYNYSKSNMPATKADLYLYEPDFEAQILTEQAYLILDRSVRYSDGFGTWPIYDDNGVYTSDAVQLFLIEYISDLTSGDAESVRQKYTAEVIEALDIPDRITQQRVYETLFTERSKREINENGHTYFKYEFKVEYKIMKNDGTFRADLASDSLKGQYFTIEQRGDDIKIVSVVEYAVK